MKKTILIIDDDRKLLELLTQFFSQFEITAITATEPTQGLKLLRTESPSLVILDVMLPTMNGFDVCREIRKDFNVPVIMLTARGDVTDRVVGLEIGADDYLPKPFEPRELLARIQSVLRRTSEKPQVTNHAIKFGNLEIDFAKRTTILNGQILELTTMEFEALKLFATHAGEVLSRDKIMEQLRGIDWDAFNRSIDVLISRLRQKLNDDPKRPTYFKTVWGTGYAFVAPPAKKDGE